MQEWVGEKVGFEVTATSKNQEIWTAFVAREIGKLLFEKRFGKEGRNNKHFEIYRAKETRKTETSE